MTGSTSNPEPDPDVEGSIELLDAIVQTRRVTMASALMWATGYVVSVMRELPQSSDAADAFTRSIWSALLQLTLVSFAIAAAVWAPRAARSLGLPNASRFWGAWVPCINPVVVLLLLWRLSQVMSDFGASKRLLFATRRRLESEL